MKFYTFYSIYYRHRIKKAKLILKAYIFIILPFSYLLNLFFLPKITNLDEIDFNKFENKTLDYLLEYFGSDKAKKVFDQYPKPIQRKKIKIKGHGYSKFYEKYFNEFKNLDCNILELGSFNGNALAAFYSANDQGSQAWCSNETGGACMVVYNGANWVRIDNSNVISA